jgi:hypothetical protein
MLELRSLYAAPLPAALTSALISALAPCSPAQGAPERYNAAACEAGVVYATGETAEFETLVTARDLSTGALLWTQVFDAGDEASHEGLDIAFVAPDGLAVVEHQINFYPPSIVDDFTNVLRLDPADGSQQWMRSEYGRPWTVAMHGPTGKAAFVLSSGDFYVDYGSYAVDLNDPNVDYPAHGVTGGQTDFDHFQYAFSADGNHLYQTYHYEAYDLFTAVASDALAHWDFGAGTLDRIDLPQSQTIPGFGGVGQGRGLGLSPDGQRLYLAGAGVTPHQLVLDPFTLEQLDALPLVRLGTSTCLAVTDAGPLYLGWRFGGSFEPSYADANFLVWIEDGDSLTQSAAKLNDPCAQNRENLHTDGADHFYLRRFDAGCAQLDTVEKRRIADGALLWSHTIQPEATGTVSLSEMAYDVHTDSLVIVGRAEGRALTYVIDAQAGTYGATYLD